MTSGVNPETGKHYRYKDRTGQRNGRLVFLRDLGVSKNKKRIWQAQCDCGKTTATTTPQKTKSCGCLQSEAAAASCKARGFHTAETKQAAMLANRKRQRRKRKTDPAKAMQARISRLYRHAIAEVNAIKASPTMEALGFTPVDLKRHLERQFHSGMSWANMNEWQIDHIIPTSEAKTKNDVIRLNQLSNLRPMWADENNKKNNKRVLLI